MDKLTVILPAYNEEDNVRLLFERWEGQRAVLLEKHGIGLQLVLVDDGSRDRTPDIAAEIEGGNGNFTLLRHGANKGLGAAVRTGIEYFINECRESFLVCIMDCDNTQDPLYISGMLEEMEDKKAHVVIASRYRKGSRVDGVSWGRLIMSGGAKLVFSALLHVPGVRDYTCGYRLYRREKLATAAERFGDKLIEENGFTCMVELLYKLYICGAKFSEVPFRLRYDQKMGSSKMSVVKTALKSALLAVKLTKIE
ncbi:glycosyltransferase family 2 protein [Bacillota bacterium]